MEKFKAKFEEIERGFIAQPFIELQDKTIRIRRNLNIVSLMSIAMTLLEIKISSISISGVKVENVTDNKLVILLLCVLLYHFVYFLWNTFDEYWRWRLQLIKENTDDESKRSTSSCSFSKSQISMDRNLYYEESALINFISHAKTEISYAAKSNDLTQECLTERLKNAWNGSVQAVIENDLLRINKFEQSYKNYHWQEVIRFALLEVGLPLLLAIYGLFELTAEIVT